ncbi:hypothetical protein EA462_10420 [Natrarchaeobius halalkaliphilus]|uniref:Uncharacterized protein n=1 Tax=Natrarchaeobius halalkaliphilus TaxID=1679091 RepID=A0A3N6LZS7_9EURY|nr:PD-(D/E)XK nuclease family protein [Natrarchaeobius halalkaliphilus]RQG88810.1 hypothetical protein EA462_10420 [Natrarchaeobius halalkaliphilus]
MSDDSVDQSRADSRIPADGLDTYLRCPRQYEFAHVYGLERDDDAVDERVDLLRRSICAALESGETDAEALGEVARTRLSSLWEDHDERFHSRAQRRHERNVLEATLEAYVSRVGADHAAGIDVLASTADVDGALVGPDRTLSSRVSASPPAAPSEPSSSADANRESGSRTVSRCEPRSVAIEASVDYVYGEGSSIVGVRFVPTLAPLGPLRYRSEWDGDVAALFEDHFDPDAAAFEPGPVGALLETAVVLEGLRTLRDRLGLEGRTCRFVVIPLADRSGTSVNWVSESVETSLEIVDLTDVYIDHHTYGMTHEHRNETVETRLETVAAQLVSDGFDPSDRWDDIERTVCPDCAYAVCCQERIATEVRFDG